MATYAEPYTLYPRRMRDGRRVWYYRPRDPGTGRRLGGISTGKLSRAEAAAYCTDLMRSGDLIPPKKAPRPATAARRSRRAPTLSEWAAERHWYEWTDDGPLCLYCRGELARSAEGSPAIQRDHADRSARILRVNILPLHGALGLDRITPADCEAIMERWSDEGASPKTINNRASVYRVIMGEAERLEIIPRSPWSRVKGYRGSAAHKGIVTIDEYRQLMDPASIATTWKGRRLHYCASLVASITGMRQSEILALRPADVHPDHITVGKKYNRKYGDGPQKTKRGTDEIPIPRFVYDQIIAVASTETGYIFSRDGGKSPIEGARLNEAVKEALEKIGIAEPDRVARNIKFHSWRAFANTYFRSVGVPDAKVRQITRHETEAMTEHYSAFRLEDFREVADAQDDLVAKLTGEKSGKGK